MGETKRGRRGIKRGGLGGSSGREGDGSWKRQSEQMGWRV